MQFASPWMLLLFLPLLILSILFLRQNKERSGSFLFSDCSIPRAITPSGALRLRHLPTMLRILTLVLVVVCLARPQLFHRKGLLYSEGIDIILTLDVSGSMQAEDFKPNNRLYVAKQVLEEFIQQRQGDRFGLVVFAREAYTQCPRTLDHRVLLQTLSSVHIGMIEDGTAIGMAIGESLNRLRDSEAKSRIIILLTDGANNAGRLDPATASKIAETLGIKIYTVGVGNPEGARVPVGKDLFGRTVYSKQIFQLDEGVLKEIADISGGLYFRATDEENLRKVYRKINELEITAFEESAYFRYREVFPPVLIMALVSLLLELVLRSTRFLNLP